MRLLAGLLGFALSVSAAEERAPLPPVIRNAKTVALVNESTALDEFDSLYARAKKVKGWTVTDDPGQADLLLVLQVGEAENRGIFQAPLGTSSIAVPITVYPCSLVIVDPRATGRNSGRERSVVLKVTRSCDGKSTGKALIGEIEKRLPKR